MGTEYEYNDKGEITSLTLTSDGSSIVGTCITDNLFITGNDTWITPTAIDGHLTEDDTDKIRAALPLIERFREYIIVQSEDKIYRELLNMLKEKVK